MRTTRREMLIGGAAAMLSPIIRSEPVKSMLGANEPKGTESEWQNPYVTDGLIAMWDGIWNIGQDKHDSSSSVWVDLVGGNNLAIDSTYASWGDDCIVLSGATTNNSDEYGAIRNSPLQQVNTIEIIGVFPGAILSSGSFFNCGYRNRGLGGFGGGWVTAKCEHSGINSKFFGLNRALVAPLRQIAFVYLDENEQEVTMFNNGDIFTGTTTLYGAPNNSLDGIGLRSNDSASVYCIRCYSVALTAAEIAYNYAVDRERFNLP